VNTRTFEQQYEKTSIPLSALYMTPDQNTRNCTDQTSDRSKDLTVPDTQNNKMRYLKRYEAAYHNKREFDEQDKLRVGLNKNRTSPSETFRCQGPCQRLLNPIGHDDYSHAPA